MLRTGSAAWVGMKGAPAQQQERNPLLAAKAERFLPALCLRPRFWELFLLPAQDLPGARRRMVMVQNRACQQPALQKTPVKGADLSPCAMEKGC